VIVIETERLALRYLRPDDLDAFYALGSDPDVYRYMDDGKGLSRELTEKWIEISMANYEDHGYGTFAITLRGEDRMIGFAGLVRPIDRPGITELIYAFPKAHWGKGYATEVARGLIAFGFERAKLDRIEATTYPVNEPSKRVLLKAGMTYDGRRPDEEDGTETDFFSIERPNQDGNPG